MKQIVIKKEDSNQRVDKYVKKMLPNAPLSFIYKLFRKKDVKINNKWVKENYILNENDELKIFITDEQFEEFTKKDDIIPVTVKFEIIYEDENIIIINKDKGILVHGDKKENKWTIQNMLLNYLIQKGEYHPKTSNFTPSLIHRLDRNTSGILICAKTLLASQEGMELFKNKENIEKHYLALTFNKAKNHDIINLPLSKDSDNNLARVDFKNGKEAITEYNLIDGNDEYSLLDVNLITGRTHQIRVHLSYNKLPIVGDEKYGDFNLNKKFKEEFDYEKQFLHAYSITFKNVKGCLSYLSNKTFKASLKEKEKEVLKRLKTKGKNY